MTVIPGGRLWLKVALCLMTAGAIGVRGPSADPIALPSSKSTLSITAFGEPLRQVLERVSTASGVRLTADRSLADQRVTIVWKESSLEDLCAALKDLLDAGDDARVTWTRTRSGGWTLADSANRQRLAARLLLAPREEYRRYLEAELAWLAAQRMQDAGAPPAQTPGGPTAAATDARRRDAACLSALGPARLNHLLEGQAVALRLGDLAPSDAVYIRKLFEQGPNPANPADGWFALVLGAVPTDAAGNYLVRTLVTPEGFARSRVSLMRMKGQKRLPFVGPPFDLPPADPADSSPKVTIRFPVRAGAPAGASLWLNLDYLLAVTAEASSRNVVADGYLRPPRQCRAGFEQEDYPLHQWLNRVSSTWNAEWRERKDERRTIIVRARHWWLEDAANVQRAVVERFSRTLGTGASGGFEDLLALAELTAPQVHKLIECGICPGAGGLVWAGWYDPVGVKPCLQFYNRLPEAAKARVRSEVGLPLRDVPGPLVEEWLSTTLIAGAGAVTPEQREDVVFSIADHGQKSQAEGRWEVALRSAGRFRTNWVRFVQPPATEAPMLEKPAAARS